LINYLNILLITAHKNEDSIFLSYSNSDHISCLLMTDIPKMYHYAPHDDLNIANYCMPLESFYSAGFVSSY